MNNIELRWLVSKDDDAEKVLQYRVREKRTFYSTESCIDRPVEASYYEWGEWMKVPVVFA